MVNQKLQFSLIVTIVSKGEADTVIEAARKAGAEGGTILHGRGTGIHEKLKLFGIPIEPEKEIILSVVERSKVEKILTSISGAVHLDIPGNGVAFTLELDKVTGICHLPETIDSKKKQS